MKMPDREGRAVESSGGGPTLWPSVKVAPEFGFRVRLLRQANVCFQLNDTAIRPVQEQR